MAITKQDCLVLLCELSDAGVECLSTISQLLRQREPTLETIKFINDNKQLDCRRFFEKIRKSYNDKHSSLYKNIVRDDISGNETLTCLASLNLQILLFLKDVEDTTMFLRQMRFEEILKVMWNFSKTGDFVPCLKLLKLFKADLKCLEEISKV